MLDLLCPVKLPAIYTVFKDMMPIWAALLAIGAAYIAYRGVMKRIRYERKQLKAVAKSKGIALAIELNVRATDLCWFQERIVEKTDHIERFCYLRDDIFTDAWLRSLKLTEGSLDRGWRDIAAVAMDQRVALAKALAAIQVGIENLWALHQDLVEKTGLVDRRKKADQLSDDEKKEIADFCEYSDEISKWLLEGKSKITTHLALLKVAFD